MEIDLSGRKVGLVVEEAVRLRLAPDVEMLRVLTRVKEYVLPGQARVMTKDIVSQSGCFGVSREILQSLDRFGSTDGAEGLAVWLDTGFRDDGDPHIYNSMGLHVFWRRGADFTEVSSIFNPLIESVRPAEVRGLIYVFSYYPRIENVPGTISDYLLERTLKEGEIAKSLASIPHRDYFLAIARKES